ncbi:sensor domain-containing diguanylate cyclase [Niveibacterium umoris]|uniref:diguanylate cyclase n=1 Tax=Niveibacterium umoris TaxID=1193620 RepID=A0A840BP37_9RHOO|nr:GGDEF domain-containing protein [Niveibacterium umoris]MBB4013298.1 diguanylate cyclase (GGDEF)-like protein/PAS domain S-box-containing protein [Niveibacterium umoris]
MPRRFITVLRRRFPAFEQLWQRFPDNVFVIRCESDGRFVVEAINPTLAAVIGRPSEAVAGLPLGEVVPAEYLALVEGRYRACADSGEPMTYEESGGPAGAEPRIWQTLMVPAQGRSGKVDYILGISRDITALRKAEAYLRDANAALERRVAERTAELECANARLTELATRDGLTGLYNRRHLFELATREFRRVVRTGQPLAVLMLDLDHFKDINDRFGHAAGDQVLRALSHVFQTALRQTDLIGRYGGEEFLVLLPDTDAREAEHIADRLRESCATVEHRWNHQTFQCTLSIGIAHYDAERDDGLDTLLQRADHALLRAKAAGRNCLVIGG